MKNARFKLTSKKALSLVFSLVLILSLLCPFVMSFFLGTQKVEAYGIGNYSLDSVTVRAKLGYTSEYDRYGENWGGGNFVARSDGKLLVTYSKGTDAKEVYLAVVDNEDALLNTNNIAANNEWVFYTRYSTDGGSLQDVSKLIQLNNGKLLLFIYEHGIQGDASKPNKVMVYRSENGLGTDFTKISEFHSADLSGARYVSYLFGSVGLPLQVPNGRIVVPYMGLYPSLVDSTSFWQYATVAYSDDGGGTWKTVKVSDSQYNEAIRGIGIFGNQLVTTLTNYYGGGFDQFYKSDDWGATWTKHDGTYGGYRKATISYGEDGYNYLTWPDKDYSSDIRIYRRHQSQPLPGGTAAYDVDSNWELVADKYTGDEGYESLFVSPAGRPTLFGTSHYMGGSIVYMDQAVPNENAYLAALLGSYYNDLKSADPVDVATGNYTYNHTDLQIPGRGGLPLDFTRYYSSRSRFGGPLGTGWSHTYQSYLRTISDQIKEVSYPDGKQVRFQKTETGEYKPLAGTLETLTNHADGTSTLTFKSQTQFLYGADGKFIAIIDKNGNRVNLSYNTAGQLEAVTDSSDRKLTFQYDAQGKLTGVTDPLTRSLVFEYDSNGKLSRAQNLKGISTSYTYDANGITSIKDGNGNVFLTNVYDTKSRVVSQTNSLGQRTTFQYDDANRKTTETNPDGGQTVYTFNESYRVTEITDPLGQKTSYTYDKNMNRTGITDPKGQTTNFTFDSHDNLLTKQDPAPLQTITKFAYDNQDNLIRQEDANGNVTAFQYDTKGNLQSETKSLSASESLVTSFTYDEFGQRTSVTNANQQTTTFTYDTYGNNTGIVDPLGNRTTYTFDLAGRKTTEISPKGNMEGADPKQFTSTFEYDKENNLVAVTDSLGNRKTFEYDGNGNKIKETDAKLNETSFTYNTENKLVSKTDPLGKVTRYEYDARGNLIREVDAKGNITRYVYDKLNRKTAVIDPLLNAETIVYDENGNVKATTKAESNQVTVSQNQISEVYVQHETEYYDKFYVEAFYNNTWNQVYTGYGNVAKWVVLPQAASQIRTKLTTDGSTQRGWGGDVPQVKMKSSGNIEPTNGKLKIVWASNNQNTLSEPWVPTSEAISITAGAPTLTYEYDALNRKMKEVDSEGGQKTYAYDFVGNLLSVTDENNHKTSLQYDNVYRLVKVTDAKNQITSYNYDKVGNKTEVIDANGKKAAYQYDALNRVIEEKDPLNQASTFQYDPAGNLLKKTDATGKVITYDYDPENRLTKVNYPDATNATYSYDELGNRTSMTNSAGTTSYQFDKLNHLTQVTYPGNKTVSYTYDELGNKTSLTYPDGKQVSYQYDNAGQLVKTTDWNGKITETQYNKDGNKTKDLLPNGVTADLAYNPIGELTSITNQKGDTVLKKREYTYDLVGNRTSMKDEAGKIINYQYDELERLTKVQNPDGSSISYTYDAVGNRLSQDKGTERVNYQYDAANRLTEAQTVAPDNAVIGSKTFAYDANGSMIKKGDVTLEYDAKNQLTKVQTPNGPVTYAYDADGTRVSKTVNGKTTRFIYDITEKFPQVLAEIDENGEIVSKYIQGTNVIGKVDNTGTESYYLYDGLGSVIGVTNTAGEIIGTYDYDVFGTVKSQTGKVDNNLMFTGEFTDPETGFIYLRDRYYDPSTGRFISKDSFAGYPNDPRSLHKYSYAYNNPVNLKDPSGRSPMEGDSTWFDSLRDIFGELSGEYDIKRAWYGIDPETGEELAIWQRVLAGVSATPFGKIAKVGKGVKMAEKAFGLRLDLQFFARKGSTKGNSTLYHYTNEKGLNGILESNKLKPSLKANNPKDARYGNGQYLSDIIPETTTPASLASKFIRVPNKYKYTNFVEIDVTGLDVTKGRNGVYVILNEGSLDITGRIVRSGKVGE